MKVLQFLTILCLVCWVSASNVFIGEGKRAKLFELTDDELPIFKVTIPENEFNQIKNEADVGGPEILKLLMDFVNNLKFDEHHQPIIDVTDPKVREILVIINKLGIPQKAADVLATGPKFSNEGYKTKNATLVVEIDGKEKSFKKVTLSLAGNVSRIYSKRGFNIKIRNNKNLYGRSHIRMRPDASEATFLRSKLSCDILNRLGLTSLSSNYAKLYINDEYMGLYNMMDSFKLSWAEYAYDDENTTGLIQCPDSSSFLTVESSSEICKNENEEVTDNSEWVQFLTALDNAQSIEEIEKFFDVDHFLKLMAYEYLFGAWDNFLVTGHNYYLYKQQNGKWKFLLYDFDNSFGHDIDTAFKNVIFNKNTPLGTKNYPELSFTEWAKPSHIVDVLILKDPTRFNSIIKEVVADVFNPATLYPYIDQLKEKIRPYVELDKTPDENGHLPGRINPKASEYTLDEWDANSEFTTINSKLGYFSYGLKYWILAKYRYVCKNYDLDCDATYLDESFTYEINEEIEYKNNEQNTPVTTEVPQSTEVPQPTEVPQQTETPAPQQQQYKCISEVLGYPCCPPEITEVYVTDINGDWAYDYEKQVWCGLTPYKASTNPETEECWSESLNYPCCDNCVVYEVDDNGKWGYDFQTQTWCGSPSYCQN